MYPDRITAITVSQNTWFLGHIVLGQDVLRDFGETRAISKTHLANHRLKSGCGDELVRHDGEAVRRSRRKGKSFGETSMVAAKTVVLTVLVTLRRL